MKNQNSILILLASIAIIIALLLSCAEPSLPMGGPKDTQAPRINPKRYSTPNKSTNFRDNQLILTFDEWIKLQSAHTQVVISPLLEAKPEIKIRNKSVVVKWKEKLKDSTTYTINFGDAVRDITENNIVPNLRMVFSTGPFLDSLSCSGQILDAATRLPKNNVLVMLYLNLEDSIPLSQKPYYFSKTDKQGNFKIENIKKSRYKIFALEDKNRNYKYDLADEQIAFLDSTFLINDSLQPLLRLRMFKEREETKIYDNRLVHFGCLKLEYNNKLQTTTSIELLDPPSDYKTYIEQGEDTLTLWFDGPMAQEGKWLFVVKNDAENLTDTIRVSSTERSSFVEFAADLRWFKKQKKAGSGKGPAFPSLPLQDTAAFIQAPHKPVELFFVRPIEQCDSSQVLLFKDTSMSVLKISILEQKDSATAIVTWDTISQMVLVDTFIRLDSFEIMHNAKTKSQLEIHYDWNENQRYKILFLPNALTDFFGMNNPDTLSRIYAINSIEDYGSVIAIVKGADSSMQYLVQLLDAQNNTVKEAIVRDSTEMTFVYKNIKTGTYTIRIVHDNLPNGRWDVGSYKDKRQAEKTTNSKSFVLNPGWENSMEVNLNPNPVSTPQRGQNLTPIDKGLGPREDKN